MPKVAIIIYSLYHHVAILAESVKAGIEADGKTTAEIFQVAETLSDDILAKMHAPPKRDYPIITAAKLPEFDGFMFGVPTRFGNFPSQMKAFIDSTGGLWASGGLYQKPAGVFISTGTGGGNEVTVQNCLSTFAHHGMIYVPLGYAAVFADLTDLSVAKGGSPYGAGTIAGPDGSRTPLDIEKKIAKVQGQEFSKVVVKLSA